MEGKQNSLLRKYGHRVFFLCSPLELMTFSIEASTQGEFP